MKKNRDFALENAKNLLFHSRYPQLLSYGYHEIGIHLCNYFATLQSHKQESGRRNLFNLLDVDISIMSDIVNPGTVIGMMEPDVARQAGINPIPVVAVCSHDTGSAIVAVPAEGDDWAYISSGTWSLMGVENRTSGDQCQKLRI